MRARLVFVALLSALPLVFAVACGGSEPPVKTGGEEKPTGDDTTDTSSTSTATAKPTETSTVSVPADDGPSKSEYDSMPIVTCEKTKCAQGQVCATIACRPGEKCAEKKVCATPLNYKP